MAIRRKIEKRKRTRLNVQWNLLRQRIGNEKLLLLLLILALAYSSVSNIISNCCPIECAPRWVGIGNAVDNELKNISYGVIGGIFFYLVNDVYKNVVEKTSDLNNMFHELSKLQFHAYTLVDNLSDDYNKNMSRNLLFQCVMKKLCNEDDEFHQIGSLFKERHVSVDNITYLIDKWYEANALRIAFLNTYGDLVTRDEYFNLTGYGNSWANELIKRTDVLVQNYVNELFVISDRDIAVIVNCILNYKLYLTDLTRKYMRFSYSKVYLNRPYMEEDIH